ncbi:MAG: hypothetical protein P1U80_09950 [Pseudomonadales bacterium]|nr:hypothetical protein [Pseudomonadales bacterium]
MIHLPFLIVANHGVYYRHHFSHAGGDSYFVPGQPDPIHTHAASSIGYVAKGNIFYQVEGEGETNEPAGQRILQFNNASATEEAIFVDFNIQQDGKPFIVFENEPTEHIDRRSLPTVELAGEPVGTDVTCPIAAGSINSNRYRPAHSFHYPT